MAYAMKSTPIKTPRKQTKAQAGNMAMKVEPLVRQKGVSDMTDREPRSKGATMKQMYKKMTPRGSGTNSHSGNF